MPRRKPCGKVIYRNRIRAAYALARIPVKEGRHESRVYFCRSCHGYHLTSKI